MTPEQEAEVIKVARAHGILESNPKEGEADADRVLTMAQEAWYYGIRGISVEEVLRAGGVELDV